MEDLIKTGRKYDLYVYELNEIEQAYLQRDYYKIEKALKHMYNLLKRSLSENIYHCTKKELKNKLKENDQNLYHFIYAIDTLGYTYCDSFPEEINFYDYDFFELLLEFSNAVEQKYPESLKIKMYDYNRLRNYHFIEEKYFLSLVEERNVLSIIKFVQYQYNILIHLIKYCQVSCDETINLLLKELGSIIQILNFQTIKINNEYVVMIKIEEFFQKQSQLEEIILIKYPGFNNYQKHLQKSKDWSWYQEKCELIKYADLYLDYRLYDALENYVIDKLSNYLAIVISDKSYCFDINKDSDLVKNTQIENLLFKHVVLKNTVAERYHQYQEILQNKIPELTSVIKYIIERYGDIFQFEKDFKIINLQEELLDVKKTVCLKELCDNGKLTEFMKLYQKLNRYLEKMISEQVLHKKYKDVYRLIVDSDHLGLDILNDYFWQLKYNNELIAKYYDDVISYEFLEELQNSINILFDIVSYCQNEYYLKIKYDSLMIANIERLLELSAFLEVRR